MDAKTQEMLVGLAKDWLTGGVSAGVSKTAVAPIGENFLQCITFYVRCIFVEKCNLLVSIFLC